MSPVNEMRGADRPTADSAQDETRNGRQAVRRMGYERPPPVMEQLEAVRVLTREEILARAHSLKEEVLVSLIRTYRGRDAHLVERLAECLIEKCKPAIFKVGRSLTQWARHELRDEVVAKLFKKILTAKQDEVLYLECAFGRALPMLAIDARRKIVHRLKHERFADDPAETAAAEAIEKTACDQINSRPEERALLLEGLDAIHDIRHRKAFILRHREGWPIEADDPDMPSISKYFEVTPRTVQNWLTKAEEALTRWRRGK